MDAGQPRYSMKEKLNKQNRDHWFSGSAFTSG
jgi:hypothetical protein